MKLIEGTASIEKAIKSIHGRGAKLDTDIQVAGLSVLAHIEKHGDVTLADRLHQAMPKGSRALALAQWMMTFGKVRALVKSSAEDAEAIKAGRVYAFDKTKNTDMQGATDTAWHSFKKEAEVSDVFDVQAAVQALIKRIQAAQKAGKTVEHADMIEALAKIGG